MYKTKANCYPEAKFARTGTAFVLSVTTYEFAQDGLETLPVLATIQLNCTTMFHRLLRPLETEFFSLFEQDFDLPEEQALIARDILYHSFTSTFLEKLFTQKLEGFYDAVFGVPGPRRAEVSSAISKRMMDGLLDHTDAHPEVCAALSRVCVRYALDRLRDHYEMLHQSHNAEKFKQFLIAG